MQTKDIKPNIRNPEQRKETLFETQTEHKKRFFAYERLYSPTMVFKYLPSNSAKKHSLNHPVKVQNCVCGV